MDDYKMLMKQLENDYKIAFRQMSLDDIIDINSIEPPTYEKIETNYGEIKLNPNLLGCFIPEERKICIKGEFINDYFKSLKNQDLLSLSYSNFLLYYTFFHEWTHYVRWSIIYKLNRGPYYEYLKDRFTEELTAEAASILLLSKKFRDILLLPIKSDAKDGLEFVKYLFEYYDDKSGFYGYHGSEFELVYSLGMLLGYLLLNIDENKQKEYLKRLLKTYTKDDLKGLIYDLERDLPKNEEIIRYYNLLKDIIEEKAVIAYIF